MFTVNLPPTGRFSTGDLIPSAAAVSGAFGSDGGFCSPARVDGMKTSDTAMSVVEKGSSTSALLEGTILVKWDEAARKRRML
jgi:hypothetical protein